MQKNAYFIRKVLYLIMSCFLIIFLHTDLICAQEDPLTLYARSAVLMDGDSGRILYGKESDTLLPMASTTKIMTCIVALEQADPKMICTVSSNAAAQPKVKLGMQTGEQYYLKDLLYSLMLESHNDTAVCIAENIAGSVENFAFLMNQKAEEIGCKDTYYITPNGLDAESGNEIHHTTAEELSRVMRYCISISEKSEEFLEITGTKEWSFTDLKEKRSHYCYNHNKLLDMVNGVISGKTGYTSKAGYCYVGAMEKDGKHLIVSLLACGWPNHRGYKWSDSKKLFRYGLENFTLYEIDCTDIKTGPVLVKNGKKEVVNTEIQDNSMQNNKCLVKKDEEMKIHIQLEKELIAPINKGRYVGMLTYSVGDFVAAEYQILTAEAAEKTDFLFCLKACINLFAL